MDMVSKSPSLKPVEMMKLSQLDVSSSKDSQRDVEALALDKVSVSKGAGKAASEAKTRGGWGNVGKAAAVISGIAAGAAIAGIAAQAATQGTLWINAAFFKYLVPANSPNPQLAAAYYVQNIERGLQMAPAAGAIAGGIIGGLAASAGDEKEKPITSTQDANIKRGSIGSKILGGIKAALHDVRDTMREAGEAFHEGVEGVGKAKSLGEAITTAGGAGYQVGEAMGKVGGFVEGAYQGSALGAIFVGAPFVFPPLSVPLAIAGALGMGVMLSQIAGFIGGIAGVAGGAVAGGVGYGIKKIVDAVTGHPKPVAAEK